MGGQDEGRKGATAGEDTKAVSRVNPLPSPSPHRLLLQRSPPTGWTTATLNMISPFI